ncbi:MAG: alpha/beta fold hydrolase [Bacteroidota bacterium]
MSINAYNRDASHYSEFQPDTRYAKCGDINIAYQVFGSGPVDLIYIPGWISNIDFMWQCPEMVQFLLELGKMARVILFDKRGTGLSDRVVEIATLEDRMNDIRTVMDAVGSERAVLFGHSEGGSVSALFAATYPNRVVSLMMFGAFAKRKYASDYPWVPTEEERQKVYHLIENNWGSSEMQLEKLAPSKADDPLFMSWLADYFRSGASPSAALLLTKMNTEVDIVGILNSINVPTLIMQRKHDVDVRLEEAAFLAERISGAQLTTFEGEDHLFWVGNTEEILHEMRSFIAKHDTKRTYEKQLYPVMVVRRPKTENLVYDAAASEHLIRIIERSGGRLILEKENLVVIFDGLVKAVGCGMELINRTRKERKTDVGVGIHMMELGESDVEVVPTEMDAFFHRFVAKILPSEMILTQPTRRLLSGVGFEYDLKEGLVCTDPEGTPLTFFTLTMKEAELPPEVEEDSLKAPSVPTDHPFIEQLTDYINQHMSESISVDDLCKALGVSGRQLQRKLKTLTNQSPCYFIRSIKLNHAKELMLSTPLNVSEISYKTGFSSPSYFSRKFKEAFGVSPSAFINEGKTSFFLNQATYRPPLKPTYYPAMSASMMVNLKNSGVI